MVFPTERLVVVSAGPRSSPLALREALFMEGDELPLFLARLRKGGVAQAVVVSTCDRTEVQAVEDDPARAVEAIVAALAERSGRVGAELRAELSVLRGAEAVGHVFALAASLDSLVVGEPQVLGQIKESHRVAAASGMVGRGLETLLQGAYQVAKRVRSETAIGEKPVSIASAAIGLARDLFGDIAGLAGLVIGEGEMGDLLVEGFRQAGLGRLVATAPAPARAAALARRLDCHEAPFEALARALAEADVVLSAVGSRRYIITVEMVEAALKARRRRPVFLVDGGIPGDVEPAVGRLEDAFLFDLADLEKAAWEGRAEREAAAREARAIVAAGVEAFLRGQAARVAVPLVSALRSHFEAVRRDVLAEGARDPEEATRRLVNRLLHAPSDALRELAGGGEAEVASLDALVRRLFRLRAEEAAAEPEGQAADADAAGPRRRDQG
ncbi:MAG: glutamyl-tRNA reductase [Proteobacteria bacterium]|nr:glutamyl-tRNA reductase [Pseudomonadota bacterium]